MSEKAFYQSLNLQPKPPSFQRTSTVTTTSTLATPTRDITYYICDASAGAITVTLPLLSAITYSQVIYIVNVGTVNAVSITAGTANTINSIAAGVVWKALAITLAVQLRKSSDTAWVAIQG